MSLSSALMEVFGRTTIMRVIFISAIFTLHLSVLVYADIRIGHFTILKKQREKQDNRNRKEENDAIKEKLDEYFATVHPVDLKYGITTDKANQLNDLYKIGDKNRDGKLSLDEMKDLVETKNLLNESELKELLEAADTNHDGELSTEELASYIAHTELKIENINADFTRDKARLLDLNKDGFISMEEFQRMYRFCNQNFNRQLIEMIIKVGDQDKDRQLSYKELTSILKSKDVLEAGGDSPEENTFKRIKACMARFIEKCKNGFCNRRLQKTQASLKDLIKLPFMSWL